MFSFFKNCNIASFISETFTDLNTLLENFDKTNTVEPDIAEPNIFNQPNKYARITHLRSELEQPVLEDYLKNFEFTTKDDTLMVGSITLEDVQVNFL